MIFQKGDKVKYIEKEFEVVAEMNTESHPNTVICWQPPDGNTLSIIQKKCLEKIND